MIGPQKIGHALEGWEIRKSKFDCGHELKRFLKWISSFRVRHWAVFLKIIMVFISYKLPEVLYKIQQ